MTDLPKLLTIEQLCKHFSVRPRTIWRWEEEGLIPRGVRFTRCTVRWRACDIEQLKASDETPPPPPAPVVSPLEQLCYDILTASIRALPNVKNPTDSVIYKWAKTQPQFADKLPATAKAFSTALKEFRRNLENEARRASQGPQLWENDNV